MKDEVEVEDEVVVSEDTPEPSVAVTVSALEQPTQAVVTPSIVERLLYHAAQIEKLGEEMRKVYGVQHVVSYEMQQMPKALRSAAGHFLSLK